MKKVLIAAGIIILVLVALRIFFGNEDAWLCSDGAWIKHGNPSAPMPTEPCN